MATIGAIDPTTAAASQAATSGSSTAASPTQGLEKTANTETFLKLLVTQMRNQDPLNPSDGTQFVAQLAQFQQLEQSMNTGQDIAAMRSDLDQMLAGTTGSTSGTTQT